MRIPRMDKSASIFVKLGLAVALVLFVFVARTAPHPANFAPVAAIALFGGAIFPRRWAIIVPVVAMIVSDLVIGLHPLVLFAWGSFAFIAFASSRWLHEATPLKVGLSSMGASVLFYLVTNFGVWTQGLMYPMNAGGLVQCYVNALPFFRGTLLGDLFYSSVLFGLFAVVYRFVGRSLRSAPVTTRHCREG